MHAYILNPLQSRQFWEELQRAPQSWFRGGVEREWEELYKEELIKGQSI